MLVFGTESLVRSTNQSYQPGNAYFQPKSWTTTFINSTHRCWLSDQSGGGKFFYRTFLIKAIDVYHWHSVTTDSRTCCSSTTSAMMPIRWNGGRYVDIRLGSRYVWSFKHDLINDTARLRFMFYVFFFIILFTIGLFYQDRENTYHYHKPWFDNRMSLSCSPYVVGRLNTMSSRAIFSFLYCHHQHCHSFSEHHPAASSTSSPFSPQSWSLFSINISISIKIYLSTDLYDCRFRCLY